MFGLIRTCQTFCEVIVTFPAFYWQCETVSADPTQKVLSPSNVCVVTSHCGFHLGAQLQDSPFTSLPLPVDCEILHNTD